MKPLLPRCFPASERAPWTSATGLLHINDRYRGARKFAGEADLFAALAVKRDHLLDANAAMPDAIARTAVARACLPVWL